MFLLQTREHIFPFQSPHLTPTPSPFLLCSNGPKKKQASWWVQRDKVCWWWSWMWVHSNAVWSLLWLLCLLKTKYIWFNKFGNMNFPQHPDKGRSGRVRSIWRSLGPILAWLSTTMAPECLWNAPRFYLGVRFKRKHVPSLNSAFYNHNVTTTRLSTVYLYGKER